MKYCCKGKRVSGIIGILPQKEVYFEDEVNNYNFPPSQTMKLKKIMGFEKHRIVSPDTATSDLCVYGLNYLTEKEKVRKEEIGAVIVLSVTPDYFIYPVSNIIQDRCGLSKDVLCLDIHQGCVAFITGLLQGSMMLDIMPDKKVVVMNADVLSKKVSVKDRNSFPLIGDGAAITILENSESEENAFINIYNDGSRGDALIIPAGGSRMPCSDETSKMVDCGDGNLRSLDNLKMDGTAVYTFVQGDVPPLIEETLNMASVAKDEIDWFLFHQPNKFMLRKLAEKLNIPQEKVFMNLVETMGNPSGASVPINIAFNLGEKLISNRYQCCLSAFGSGLTWGAAVMTLGNMEFCETLISPY